MKLKRILILSLFTLSLFTTAVLINVDINTNFATDNNNQQDDKRLKLSYTDITAEEAHDMIYNKTLYPDLLALDVRSQSEYDSGHICNATLIPHTQLESRISELEPYKDTEIVVYCGSGVRSVTACNILDSHDFTKVFNMLGGMSAWNSEGYEVCIDDLTPPTWDEVPTDQLLEYCEIFIYDLDASDPSGIDEWWLNDTTFFSINNFGLISNNSPLPIGEYWLEVNVNDTYGNTLMAIFKVTVQDTTSPFWVLAPSDKTIEFGSSFNYDLDASDPSGIDEWWLNDTTYFDIDGNGIITNKTLVPIGEYWLEVNVNDTYGNTLTDKFKITVEDNIAPTWDEIPTDQLFEYCEAFYYNLNASDTAGIDEWWLNDTIYFDIDGNGVITNNSLVPIGEYWVEVNVNDTYGNTLTDSFKVTVQDTKSPSWVVPPSDKTMEFGDSFNYDLDASDPSNIDMWWLNETTFFNINNAGLITNNGPVPIGEYWLEVNVNDTLGNKLTGTFKVTVEDTTSPSWVQDPSDKTMELGGTFNYDLNATDLSGIGSWELNDTIYFDIDGNGVITNKILVPIGEYWLEVNVNDTYGNTLTDKLKITVEDTTPPSWVEDPSDKTMELGGTFNYDLNATDLSGVGSWELNDTMYFDIDGSGIITNKGLVPVGIYWLEVTVEDTYNNPLTDRFKITVEDTTPPSWAPEPTDRYVDFGDGLNYDLNATDLSGIGSWELNDTTYFNIDSNG
ncbi:MAG: rhodanese-like domain-containing protein, partial [Promethearchaeota archaeon]